MPAKQIHKQLVKCGWTLYGGQKNVWGGWCEYRNNGLRVTVYYYVNKGKV